MFILLILLVIALIIYFRRKGHSADAVPANPLPAFPQTGKDGTQLMKTVSFTLSGVNHTNDGSDPQKVIKPGMKGQWLTLQADPKNKYDKTAVKVLYNGQYIGWLPASNVSFDEIKAKEMIFNRLTHGLEVLALLDHTTYIQIGGWDLDEDDPRIGDYEFTSAVITCAIYELPGGRYPK